MHNFCTRCAAVFFVHPIDVVKNRMQVNGEGGTRRQHKSSVHAFGDIARNEGFPALYKGFTANLARQLTYTTSRLGLFQILADKFSGDSAGGLASQVGASLTAGTVAAAIATPTDVALIRMTVDGGLPTNERRNYKHVGDALHRIAKDEGVLKLWTGVKPTVLRAMLANVTQLVPYYQAKRYFVQNGIMEDVFGCHVISSLISGLIYAFTTCPLDSAKTRIQSMKTGRGREKYTGIIDVWRQMLKTEGPSSLWKGFTPYYVRIAPYTTLLFIFLEQLTRLNKWFISDKSGSGGW